MTPTGMQFTAQLLQILGGALVITAFWMLAARRLLDYIHAYTTQSLVVAGVAAVAGASIKSADLFLVAGLTVLVKAVAITAILRRIARRLPLQREARPAFNLPTSLLVGMALMLLALLSSTAVIVPGTFLNEPPLAVSLALVLIGLFLISSRRHVLAQMVGLLTIENGLFSGAIAIAYGMPLLVEFGILFDVLIAVALLELLVALIQRQIMSPDTAELRKLRG